jgi:chemotaxis protein MotB
MLSYGDMMTQIVVFFAMVIAFSTVGAEKFRAAIGSFRGAVTWLPGVGGTAMMEAQDANVSAEAAMEAAEQLQTAIGNENLEKYIEVYQAGGGVRIVFSDPVLFDVGDDQLKPAGFPILLNVVEAAKKMANAEVLIEGHTDDTPIHNQRFPSNWELSSARAMTILRFFEAHGFPSSKLVAVGYGEHRPRVQVPSTADKGQKAPNRRVEIMVQPNAGERHSLLSPSQTGVREPGED